MLAQTTLQLVAVLEGSTDTFFAGLNVGGYAEGIPVAVHNEEYRIR